MARRLTLRRDELELMKVRPLKDAELYANWANAGRVLADEWLPKLRAELDREARKLHPDPVDEARVQRLADDIEAHLR